MSPANNRASIPGMAQRGRDTRRPIARTYITKTKSPSGKTTIHARVYSPSYDVDLRGTGSTVDDAVGRVLDKLRPKRTKKR